MAVRSGPPENAAPIRASIPADARVKGVHPCAPHDSPSRRRVSATRPPRHRPGTDGHADRHGQGRAGRDRSRRRCSSQLAGAHWRRQDSRRTTRSIPVSDVAARGRPSSSTSSCPDSRRTQEENIPISVGATIERTPVLTVAGVQQSVWSKDRVPGIEARGSGFETSFGPEDINRFRRGASSMFDSIRAAPGVSPTSPSSGSATTVSAFGSGTNENHVSDRRRQLHLPVQRRRAPRSPASTSFRKSRSSQSARRPSTATSRARSSTSSPGREATIFSSTRRTFGTDGRPDESAGACRMPAGQSRAATSAPPTATPPRTLAGRWCASGSGSSPATSTCATTTASRGPTRIPEDVRAGQDLREADWRLTPGCSWCKAFTTSSGSTPSARRS